MGKRDGNRPRAMQHSSQRNDKGLTLPSWNKGGHIERHSQCNNVLTPSQLSELHHWPSSKAKSFVLSASIPFQQLTHKCSGACPANGKTTTGMSDDCCESYSLDGKLNMRMRTRAKNCLFKAFSLLKSSSVHSVMVGLERQMECFLNPSDLSHVIHLVTHS